MALRVVGVVSDKEGLNMVLDCLIKEHVHHSTLTTMGLKNPRAALGTSGTPEL